jgi:hypothetical protein
MKNMAAASREVLNQILLKVGGSGLDSEDGWATFSDPRVVDFLSKHGREFSTEGLQCIQETPFPDWRKSLGPDQCHRNCIDLRCYVGLTGVSEYRIVHGWALSDGGVWYCHSWCIRKTGLENIIETTRRRVSYFGFILPQDLDPRVIHWNPGRLGDLLADRGQVGSPTVQAN